MVKTWTQWVYKLVNAMVFLPVPRGGGCMFCMYVMYVCMNGMGSKRLRFM